MKRLKHFALSLLLATTSCLALPAFAGTSIIASADSSVTTACKALGSASCTDTHGGPGLTNIVRSVINLLSLLIGIISVIMIIIGGLRYVTSNGDSTGAANARNTIIYAVIGLVVAAMAQLLVQFVLGRLG